MEHTLYAEKVNKSLNILKGIGPKKAALFEKLGISTIWDLLYYFPRNYEDRTRFNTIDRLVDGETCSVNVIVASSVMEKKIKSKMSLYIFRAEDGRGILSVKWFSSPFNRNKIKKGMRLTLYGTVSISKNTREMVLRDYDKVIAISPNFPYSYYNRANIRCERKDFNAALADYNRAIELNPDFAEAYFNRGLVHTYMGNNDKAIADLSKAGELGMVQAYNVIKLISE